MDEMPEAGEIIERLARENERQRFECGGAHSMSQRGVYGKERDNAG